MSMLSKIPLLKGKRAPLLLMVLTILFSFLAPTVLAQPDNPSKKFDMQSNQDLAYNLDTYFTMVDYNEPSNPYILINYYFENGSHVRMIFGVDKEVFPTLNLNYQSSLIQVFDNKGKIGGYGIRTRSKSNLFVYVPV
jgi:hypothetical protein